MEVPGGLLACTASWLDATLAPVLLDTPSAQILVTLDLQQPRATSVVRTICELGLSPLQSRIALYAAAGGARDSCAMQNRISVEALKKHLQHIYAVSGAHEWAELRALLQTTSPTTSLWAG